MRAFLCVALLLVCSLLPIFPASAVSPECTALGERLVDLEKGRLSINALSPTEAEILLGVCEQDAKAEPDNLLLRLYLGLGLVRLERWQEAEGHLQRASEPYPVALVPYALMYYRGLGVPQDMDRAKSLLARAGRIPAAQLMLGNILHHEGDTRAALPLWQAAAATGYAEAERALGFVFLDGAPGVQADAIRAKAYFLGAAEKSDRESMVQYLFLLEDQEGRNADYFRWLRAAAEAGDEWAMSQWALALASGDGAPKDEQAAFLLMARAAQMPEGYGRRGLADFYRAGIGTEKDPEQAFSLYMACAEEGDTTARTNAATMLADGEGIARDEKRAYRMMLQSAEAGDRNAQAWLGWYLYRLDQENMSEAAWNQAVHWSAKAAEGGDADVRFAAAAMLLSRWASAAQEQKAVAELTALAKSGFGPAMLRLSQAWAEGLKSAPRDVDAARDWAEKALAAGAPGARSRLAGLLFYEFGTEIDLRQAAALWRTAAEDEADPVAAYMLGHLCLLGDGVPQNSLQSVDWLRRSIHAGYTPARQLLASVLLYGAPDLDPDSKESLALCAQAIADYEKLPVGVQRLKLVDALRQAAFLHSALNDRTAADKYLTRAEDEAKGLAALGEQALTTPLPLPMAMLDSALDEAFEAALAAKNPAETEAAMQNFSTAKALLVAADLEGHPYFLARTESIAGQLAANERWSEAFQIFHYRATHDPLGDTLRRPPSAKTASLQKRLAQLDALLRTGFDRKGGEHGPDPRAMMQLARSLADEIAETNSGN